jgi:hypothetical protein
MSQQQETRLTSVYFAVTPFKNRFYFVSLPKAAIFLQRVPFIAQLSQDIPAGGELLLNKALALKDT